MPFVPVQSRSASFAECVAVWNMSILNLESYQSHTKDNSLGGRRGCHPRAAPLQYVS